MIKVLFVCLGNICRSPLAEGIFRQLVKQQGLEGQFEIDSAATSHYEVGNRPDHRTVSNARKNGLELDHCARQFRLDDYHYYDHILVMDKHNLHDLRTLLQAAGLDTSKIELLRTYDPTPGDMQVPDPYYGGPEGFDLVFDLVSRSCANLLQQLVQRHALVQ